MDPRVAQLAAHLSAAQAILSELSGTPAAAPAPAPAPVPAPAPSAAGVPGSDFQMRFGKYKGRSLQQIMADDITYIGWVADKYGVNRDGSEDPKYMADNARVRAVAKAMLGAGGSVLGGAAPVTFVPNSTPSADIPTWGDEEPIPF